MEELRRGGIAPPAADGAFHIFWIKHVGRNYSAIMRQRVVIKGERAPLPVQLFDRRVFQRYNRWLSEVCQ